MTEQAQAIEAGLEPRKPRTLAGLPCRFRSSPRSTASRDRERLRARHDGALLHQGRRVHVRLAGAAIVIGRQAITGPMTAAIALVALALLLQKRIKVSESAIVAAAAVAGLLLHN